MEITFAGRQVAGPEAAAANAEAAKPTAAAVDAEAAKPKAAAVDAANRRRNPQRTLIGTTTLRAMAALPVVQRRSEWPFDLGISALRSRIVPLRADQHVSRQPSFRGKPPLAQEIARFAFSRRRGADGFCRVESAVIASPDQPL